MVTYAKQVSESLVFQAEFRIQDNCNICLAFSVYRGGGFLMVMTRTLVWNGFIRLDRYDKTAVFDDMLAG